MMKQCAYCGEWHTSLEGCAIVPNNAGASQPLGDWRDAEIDRLRRELAEARGALQELRIRLHAAGRRPEECYEMSVIDAALSADQPDAAT